MYPNPTPNVPARPGSYVPFSNQFVPYAPSGAPPLDNRYVPAGAKGRARYDFSSEQTVDDLIVRGYLAIPTGGPVTVMLADRRHTAWLGLDDAIRQIRSRYEIYERNMHGILYGTTAATNALHTWKAERGWYSEKQIENLGKALQRLYSEERQERVGLWQDLARIRATVPEAVQTYLSAWRKLALLDDPAGDPP